MGEIFISEVLGTMMLLLFGCGVVANAILPKTKGTGGGASAAWLLINFGWGLGVFAGVFTAYKSGAHINPAVTIGLLANGAEEFAPGVAASVGNAVIYILAQLLGAFLGAVLCWVAYKQHFDADGDPAAKLGVFSTGPEIRNYGWNFATEVIGTFVLVFVVIMFGNTPNELGPLAVALLVVGIGASLGGPTGYAINPARDLGPRIAHAVLPIPGKGTSDWGYSWVPIAGPVVGGILAGLVAALYG
ncbi:MIP/aquaporin family protein [Serinicoccus chungangensis]|uniref:MIP/aquaporin family protein n=1 Tax=Serinicoccus chungangensis TaxID=767452 RepID=UPI001118BA30|nr:MIP/aquaporin family protein [Serinicoccus chungangensis]